MLDVRKATAMGCAFHKLDNEVIATKGVEGFIHHAAIDSCWTPGRKLVDVAALTSAPPAIVTVSAPPGVTPPAHTDDDPSADYLIPIASNTASDNGWSRHSPPTPNRTSSDTRSPSERYERSTATSQSKSFPPTPPQGPSEEPQQVPATKPAVRLSSDQQRLSSDIRRMPAATRRLSDYRNASRRDYPRQNQRQYRMSRPPRRVTPLSAPPRLRPRTDQGPEILLTPAQPSIEPNMEEKIRKAAAEAVAQALSQRESEGSPTARFGYGPPRLTPNSSGNNTPRGSATTHNDPVPHDGMVCRTRTKRSRM